MKHSKLPRVHGLSDALLTAANKALRKDRTTMDLALRKSGNHADIESLVADVAVLKKEIAKALKGVKSTAAVQNAVSSVKNLADSVSDEAADVYVDLSKRSRRAAKVIGRQVEDQPVLSLLVAFSAGFIISRLLPR